MRLDSAALGQIIRGERKAQGLLQVELAAASGVGVRFLVELERGKPTAHPGRALSDIATLRCSIEIKRPR
jgi:transcriptional regulator with XRE-family HTH domain